ncbi:electron transfer flavoprotein subunit beta/FixA family protein [Paenibacillus koleovorans]|uniref:electron transfer flavoprotein subunit beta/FixA family protein n=1 Tax=Paenibacillus koleovorans TaxID=121608 RepID=UPI000FDB3241|nr:electron transfer flavoprotein subunit beta/FixA family protein [Paenibacillus koleovorans]
MQIAVLLKMTFDTEEKIKLTAGKIEEDGVKFIINPYDEYAVEEAIRLRDAHGGKVTVISVGPERAAEALRTALAMGADEAVRIEPPAGRTADEAVLAALLFAQLQADKPDLVLGGFFSIDQGGGQVAIRVAARLGIPHVTAITKLEVQGGGEVAVAERDVEGATETLEVRIPALFTAQQGLNEPRYPSLPGIMKAKKKPFRVIAADELGLASTELEAATRTVAVALPPSRQAGKLLQGELDEQVRQLAELLKVHAKLGD